MVSCLLPLNARRHGSNKCTISGVRTRRGGGGAEKPLQMGVGDSDSAILFVEGRGATKQKQK